MDCTTIRQLINQWSEGSLRPDEAEAVEGHVLECDLCAEAFDALWLPPLKDAAAVPGPSEELLGTIQASVVGQPEGMADECYLMLPALSAAIDGEADPEEQALISVHVAECGHCRAAFDSMRRTEAAARAVPAYKPSGRLWKQIEAALPKPQRETVGWLGRLRECLAWRPVMVGLSAAAAAVLALLFVVPALQSPTGLPTERPGTVATRETGLDGSTDVAIGGGLRLPEPPIDTNDSDGSEVAPDEPMAPCIVQVVNRPSRRPGGSRPAPDPADMVEAATSEPPPLLVLGRGGPVETRQVHLTMAEAPEPYGYEPAVWSAGGAPPLETAVMTAPPARVGADGAFAEVETDLVVDAFDELSRSLHSGDVSSASVYFYE